MDMLERDKQIRIWLKEAAIIIRASFNQELDIIVKSGRNDIVTNIDKEIEQFFVSNIRAFYPEDQVLAEEGMGEEVTNLSGIVWIIDPIDGTLNFVEQKRDFTISIGIYQDGIGKLGYIYDLARDELYVGQKGRGASVNGRKLLPANKEATLSKSLIIVNLITLNKYPELWNAIRASRGLRLYGVASLEYMAVISGRVGVYLSANLAPWDVAGGKIIAEELGFIATRFDSSEINMLEKGTSIVAPPKIYQEVIQYYLKK